MDMSLREQEAQFEFGIKAVDVQEQEDGTLVLEGYASDFLTDRDMEAFEPGAFERGLKAFMANPILLYHHKPSDQLGVVREAAIDGKGLKVVAEFPKPPEGSPLLHVYNLVRRGMMRGFSVGGAFKRRMTATGPRIFDVDMQELSVTPLPVNPRTLFAVAGKAFSDEEPGELERLAAAVEGIETVLNTVEQRLG